MKPEIVKMADVPTPPVRFSPRKHAAIYAALEKLPADQTQAVKLPVKNYKELKALRSAVMSRMRARGRSVLSSRNEANTELYLWLGEVPKGAK